MISYLLWIVSLGSVFHLHIPFHIDKSATHETDMLSRGVSY